MSSEVFWNLTLWDWGLWMEKIISDRKRENDKEEGEWIRLSHLETLIARITGNKTAKPTDFYKPSWHKEVEYNGDGTPKITDDKRTPEQVEELKEVLKNFKKKLT